jgi:ATP-dependent DNA helicase DinG
LLDQTIKAQIQDSYRQLIESQGLTPRYGQRFMIAEIARQLGSINSQDAADEADEDSGSPPPVIVVEAGTGTGKTLAYVLGTVPLAQSLGLKVVIATATVALQEQVVLKDLPAILSGCELQFSVALAKGRGRYLCLARLDTLLAGNDSQQAMMDLYGEDLSDGDDHTLLYQAMLDAIATGDWDGDRDDWKTPLQESQWRPLTADSGQCLGPKCSHFRNCCFYRARNAMDTADVIVANHDLVLTDLSLGGGAILPAPAETVYVFDEAHHLPVKSNGHFASFTRMDATRRWLEKLRDLLGQLRREDFIETTEESDLLSLVERLFTELNDMSRLLDSILDEQGELDSYEQRAQYTFPAGVVPEALRSASENLAQGYAMLAARLERVGDVLKDEMEEGGEQSRRNLAEQWFPVVGSALRRSEANLELWHRYAVTESAGVAPVARWLSIDSRAEPPDVGLSASPVLAAENLAERLWSSCAGAVLTSATLSSLGEFRLLQMRAGLPGHTVYHRIASPFDFPNAATLSVPRLGVEPGNNREHTRLLIEAIPRLVDTNAGSLMLFSSRRQMQEVMDGLPSHWNELILCQDDFQKAELIKYHKQRLDRGEGSLIFGLASFAEGVDLPGKYCTHVLIAKIPFAVPNDPIESTMSEWISGQGENPFMVLAVPDAAFRLVQATGRLLRNESDRGRITLFDERLVSKRYGKQILDSLPAYRQELLQQDLS